MWNNEGRQTRYLMWGDLELIGILQSKEKTLHISLLMRKKLSLEIFTFHLLC